MTDNLSDDQNFYTQDKIIAALRLEFACPPTNGTLGVKAVIKDGVITMWETLRSVSQSA